MSKVCLLRIPSLNNRKRWKSCTKCSGDIHLPGIELLTKMNDLDWRAHEIFNTMKFNVREVDQSILAHPQIQNVLIKDCTEALRQGAQDLVDDMAAKHGQPWGFELNEISRRVQVWCCEWDRSVPPAMGSSLCDATPNCTTTTISQAGHLGYSKTYNSHRAN